MFKNYADVNTPITKESWKNLTDKERFDIVNKENTMVRYYYCILDPRSMNRKVD